MQGSFFYNRARENNDDEVGGVMERVYIFDTTLRDGEQAPGASLSSTEKLKIAFQLARLGVDVIEAGFPITSQDDAEAVRLVGKEVEGPETSALARCRQGDIEAALKALAVVRAAIASNELRRPVAVSEILDQSL